MAAVRPLYAELRAQELRHPKAADGLAASTALLTSTLLERGLDYDEFVWTVTP